MIERFADTYYFLALRNRRDVAHQKAMALLSQFPWHELVTTDWVLMEVGDALAAPANRKGFIELLQILKEEGTHVIPCDRTLFDRGCDLYSRRPDKSWSLTDCTSFVVMEDRGIREALTGDHHFEQAGFAALLK